MEADADPGSGLQHIRIHITELFFTVKNSVITGHNFFLSEDTVLTFTMLPESNNSNPTLNI